MYKNTDELEGLIRYHKRCYYQGCPVISDDAYDQLEKALKAVRPDSPVLKETGAPVESYDKPVRHREPMRSIDFVRDIDAFMKWYDKHAKGHDLVMTPKVDGLALVMLTTNGVCAVGATRGNGEVGTDITANLIASSNIPTDNLPKNIQELRGEIYMKKSVFEAINEGLPEKDKMENPRNAAAGSVRCKDAAVCKERNLDVMFYDIPGLPVVSELAKYQYAKNNGIPYVPTCFIHGSLRMGREKFKKLIESTVKKWEERLRDNLDFGIDGLVFAIDNLEQQKAAGYGGGGKFPNGKMAFKFESECVTVEVDRIVWQAGRTGHITPVAEFPSVNIMGSNVERATLHNRENVMRLGIVPGSKILIEKRGDIIPGMVKDTEVLSGEGVPEIPEYCPECGGETVDKGVYLSCPNKNCGAKSTLRIRQFCKVLGIKGFGPAVINKLYDAGIDSIDQFIELSKNKLLGAGIKEGTADNLITSLRGCTEATEEQMLACLGIPGIDTGTAEKLTGSFKGIDSILEATKAELTEVNGIGPKTADIIFRGLQSNRVLITKLMDYITVTRPEKVAGPLTGQVICITGSLSVSKREWQDRIEKAGGMFSKSLGKACTYLVTESLMSESSKMQRAAKLGVKVITEKTLEAIVDGRKPE